MADQDPSVPLHKTPLHAWHGANGGKLVPFAGYEMPVQYPEGIMAEHLWCRAHAGLFDVSHMGQCFIQSDDWTKTAAALEALVPADILNLKPGQQRYSQLLGEDGGILDDLMISRFVDPKRPGWAYVVVNAGCKDADYAHIRAHLPAGVTLTIVDDYALIALQGPEAVAVVAALTGFSPSTPFMTGLPVIWQGAHLHISRSGYTGEDGVEIAVPSSVVEALWAALIADPRVKPIGLGARDSLRLEGGLCLYGHDIDIATSPIEAGLQWSIQKRRRLEGGFPGAARIQRELAEGPSRIRIGIKPLSRQPAREGTEIYHEGRKIGIITSGGFGPSVNGPVAMGYVEPAFAALGTPLTLIVRGKDLAAEVAPMPFIPNRFYR